MLTTLFRPTRSISSFACIPKSTLPVTLISITIRMASTTAKKHRDPCTVSNYHQFLAKHITTNFTLDFKTKRLAGDVIISFDRLDEKSTEIVLDTSFVDVKSVHVGGEEVKWQLKPRVEPYGSPLVIEVNEVKSSTVEAKVDIN
jgi:leukotriene-A4 hydrolase